MPRYEGVQFECNRCGKTEFKPWVPLHREDECPNESEWLKVGKDKDGMWFCPECAKKFSSLLHNFLNQN